MHKITNCRGTLGEAYQDLIEETKHTSSDPAKVVCRGFNANTDYRIVNALGTGLYGTRETLLSGRSKVKESPVGCGTRRMSVVGGTVSDFRKLRLKFKYLRDNLF